MEPKKENHLKNLHGAEGVEGLTGRWRGTYYDRGVGNPRKKLDPVTQAYRETILAQNRGRDRQGNPLFHK